MMDDAGPKIVIEILETVEEEEEEEVEEDKKEENFDKPAECLGCGRIWRDTT